MARTRALWIALAGILLAGCQFASSPPSVVPNPAATRAPTAALGSSAASPTAPRPATAPPASAGSTGPAASGPVIPPPRSATPASPGATRTPTRPVPTLGRTEAPTNSSGANQGAILPGGGEQVTGELTTFAASARVMQLRVVGGGERQVSLAPSATIKRADGSIGSAADLRPGERVQMVGKPGPDSALVADEVLLLGPR